MAHLRSAPAASADDTDDLRAEVRRWFAAVMPEVRGSHAAGEVLSEEDDFAMRRRYSAVLARDGWATLNWDPRWGGKGAGYQERLVFAEEAARADAPDSLSRLGVDIIGPAIDALGTDAQKRRFLPDIASAASIWCQGFSEPDAGSDLAALRTRATRAPGGWTISGQKVWTSFGQYADMCLVLARTDPGAPAHQGISAFAVAMRSPGVRVRPIAQITGGSDFCEVFYDDVFVADGNLIGSPGEGWKLAMTALAFERSINFMTRQVRLSTQVGDVTELVRTHAASVPSRLKDRLVDLHVRAAQLRAAVEHQMSALDRGDSPGVSANASKVFWSETFQDLADLGAELEQELGMQLPLATRRWSHTYLVARSATIYAGTSEIQRNIIAERGLGLPR